MTLAIKQDKLKNAKLFSTRNDFIKTLPKNISYIEAGVLAGDFSLEVLKTVNPSIMHLVDTYFDLDFRESDFNGARWNTKEEHYKFVYKRFENTKNVILHKQTFETFFKNNKSNKFDFIYLDYEVTYSSIRNQIKMATQMLGQGGTIGFNDYNIYYNETKTGEKMGVVPAINYFVNNSPDWYVHAFALNDNLTSDIYLKKLI